MISKLIGKEEYVQKALGKNKLHFCSRDDVHAVIGIRSTSIDGK